jgi:hypothetical protein
MSACLECWLLTNNLQKDLRSPILCTVPIGIAICEDRLISQSVFVKFDALRAQQTRMASTGAGATRTTNADLARLQSIEQVTGVYIEQEWHGTTVSPASLFTASTRFASMQSVIAAVKVAGETMDELSKLERGVDGQRVQQLCTEFLTNIKVRTLFACLQCC